MILRRWPLLVTGLLGLCLAGCASFVVEPFRGGESWPVGGGTSGPVIGVRVHAETFLNDVEEGTALFDLRKWHKQTLAAYEQSGAFSEVKGASIEADPDTGMLIDPEAGLGGIDIRADVQIVERQSASWPMQLITGLTAYIIPSRVSIDFEVKTTFRDNKGQVLGVIERTNTVVIWQQIFLVVVQPFHHPPVVENEAIFNLSRVALIEAHQKGILTRKAPAPPAKP